MLTKTEINFTSTVGKAGLYTETRNGAWWIWLAKDGTVTREKNCKPVEAFDATERAARDMERVFDSLRVTILAYLNPTDTVEGSRLFWQIKSML